jgi:hypothetical protein
MTGSTVAIIVIPIVIAVCLAVWLFLVFRADRKPHGSGRGDTTDHSVTGGIFRGGRRQWSPRRDATPPEAAEVERTARAGKRGSADDQQER